MKRPMLFVTTYVCNRDYGGPEEGGWWYDTGYPLPNTTETFFNEANARRRQDERSEAADMENKANGPYGHLGSVLCTGALSVFCEDHPPAAFPATRPRYE